MKERPILFSGPMVRAILDGRKTQTRRWLMDSKLPDGLEEYEMSDLRLRDGFLEGRKNESAPWAQMVHGQGRAPECAGIPTRCPYGEPGDRLWVRETWMPFDTNLCRGSVTIGYKASNDVRPECIAHEEFGASQLFQRPDDEVEDFAADIKRMEVEGDRWSPSIYMPRWASRITLEIVGVRVERLQDISEEDSEAEGIEAMSNMDIPAWRIYGKDLSVSCTHSPKKAFKELWQSINGTDSWQANPWVWVVQFRRVEQ